ncbi:MAG: hypothetical protein AAGH15_08310 [Myxococcota bacterium]
MKRHTLRKLAKDQEGLSTVEYIIILVLIAVIGIVAWESFGQAVKDKVDNATDKVNALPDE